MDKNEQFQKKFKQFFLWVNEQKDEITKEQVLAFFDGDDLNEQQMQIVMEYVSEQQSKKKELSEKNQGYLEEYRQMIAGLPQLNEDERGILLMEYMQGNRQLKEKVIESFLPLVPEIAESMCEEADTLEDLIQEGNLGITLGVEALEDGDRAEKVILAAVRKTIQGFKDAQNTAKSQDKLTISRVEALNESLSRQEKELGRKVMVEELALDMGISKEEVIAILKLTGEVPEEAEDAKEE